LVTSTDAVTADGEGEATGRITAVTSLVSLGVFGLSAITGPLLARALGPSGRGDLAAVLVVQEMVAWMLLFGIATASVYFHRRYPHPELITCAWVFAVVTGGAVSIAGWWLAPHYLHGHDPRTVAWLRAFLVLNIAFLPAYTALSLLRVRPTMTAYNVLKASQLVIETAVLVLLAAIGKLTLGTALGAAFGSTLLWYGAILIYARAWPSRNFAWATLGAQVRYGSRVAFGDLATLTIARMDQFLLVGAVVSAKLGLYTVAATAAGASGAVAAGVSIVLFPRILASRSADDAWAALRQAARWTLMSSIGIAVLVAVAAPIGLPLLFGHAFHGSIVPLWLLLPGQVAFDLGNVISQKLMADNHPGVVSHGLALAAGVTVVGLAVTVDPFGIIGASIVTSVSQFAFLGYLVWAVHRFQPAESPAADPTTADSTTTADPTTAGAAASALEADG
jgi:O-antigen/teichoic acid export membrane protein